MRCHITQFYCSSATNRKMKRTENVVFRLVGLSSQWNFSVSQLRLWLVGFTRTHQLISISIYLPCQQLYINEFAISWFGLDKQWHETYSQFVTFVCRYKIIRACLWILTTMFNEKSRFDRFSLGHRENMENFIAKWSSMWTMFSFHFHH